MLTAAPQPADGFTWRRVLRAYVGDGFVEVQEDFWRTRLSCGKARSLADAKRRAVGAAHSMVRWEPKFFGEATPDLVAFVTRPADVGDLEWWVARRGQPGEILAGGPCATIEQGRALADAWLRQHLQQSNNLPAAPSTNNPTGAGSDTPETERPAPSANFNNSPVAPSGDNQDGPGHRASPTERPAPEVR